MCRKVLRGNTLIAFTLRPGSCEAPGKFWKKNFPWLTYCCSWPERQKVRQPKTMDKRYTQHSIACWWYILNSEKKRSTDCWTVWLLLSMVWGNNHIPYCSTLYSQLTSKSELHLGARIWIQVLYYTIQKILHKRSLRLSHRWWI